MNAATPVSLNKVAGFIFFITLLFVSTFANAKEWVLQNQNLRITFNDGTLVLKVLDKRCNKTWEQYPVPDSVKLQSVSQKGATLTLHFAGQYIFDAALTLSPTSALKVSISAAADMPMKELLFPGAFKSPKDHYLLLTDGEGLLLPVVNKDYPLGNGITYYCGGGLSMAWMGVTDKDMAAGYMAILETPYDAELHPKRRDGIVTFEPVWLPSKEQFGYTRNVTYAFFDKGGYVAQCKRYRSYVWEKNKIETLKEKAAKTASINKMVGGVHIYVWDNARTAAFAKELKDAGVEKAMLLWNPNHLPYPAKGYDDSIKELGYAAGVYELFTDENIRDTAWYDLAASPTYLKRNAYPGLYNQLVARKKDGTAYTNQFGHFISPKAALPVIEKRITKETAIWPHETYFLDVYEANGLYESYAKEAPLTREQWAEAIKANQQFIIDKYKVFLGGEWGADFSGSQISYAHGMMTLQRTWWGTEVGKKGTVYYGGDWKNGPRPSIMLGERTAPPKYMQYSINEALRVPLYELVYHDAIVTSWRWEDANHHSPEIWWKKDLFNILYGTAPLWSIDRDRWENFKNTFVQSYKTICPWLGQVGYDELLSHRFISTDRKVQESVFSSGKKVVVNFGDADYKIKDKTIPARGFAILQTEKRSGTAWNE